MQGTVFILLLTLCVIDAHHVTVVGSLRCKYQASKIPEGMTATLELVQGGFTLASGSFLLSEKKFTLAANYGALMGELDVVIRHSCPKAAGDVSREDQKKTVVVPETTGFFWTADIGDVEL